MATKTPLVQVEVGAWLGSLTGDADGLLTSERTNHCFHFARGAVVDKSARTLRCSQCSAPLDPYEYLDFLARDGDAVVRARKLVAKLNASVKALKKREQNAKARVKRWEARAKELPDG